MTRAAAVAAILLALAGAATPARAQTAADLMARGIRASTDLDYDSAATLLRAALDRSGLAALPDSSRARALMYLGATEYFRNNRDSAAAAFRRLLLVAPRFRPDQLIFPPEVSSLFEEVRIGTPAVAVVIPPQTEIRSAGDRLDARLYAASLHMIAVSIVRAGGAPVRTLYNGAIGDSLELLWDGRDSAGVMADSGSYLLRVGSRGQTARVVRTVDVGLDIRTAPGDTLPLPPPFPDSLLLPERGPATVSGTRALLVGLGAAGAAIVLPSFAGSGSGASASRFVVGTATGLAGLFSFAAARRPQPLPANIAANQTRRLAWEQRLEAVRAENRQRRRDARLVIRHTGTRVSDTP